MNDQNNQCVSPSQNDGNGQSESKSTFFQPRASPHIPENSAYQAATETMTQYSCNDDTKRSSIHGQARNNNNLVTVEVCESAAASYALENAMNRHITHGHGDEVNMVTFPIESTLNRLSGSAERGPSVRIDNGSSAVSKDNDLPDEQRSYKSSAFLQEKNSTIMSQNDNNKKSVLYSEQRSRQPEGHQLNANMGSKLEIQYNRQGGDGDAMYQDERQSEEFQQSIQNYRNLRQAGTDENEQRPPLNIHCDYQSTQGNVRPLRDSFNDSRKIQSAVYK